VELANGQVLLNVRTEAKEGRRVIVESKDGATQWSKPRFQEDLPDPVCFASLIRDGRALLFVNPASGSRARINLAVRASYDDGAHWTLKRVIEPGGTGYADIAVSPDGTILCFFESTPKLPDGPLRHDEILARFKPDWLDHP
jgi:sialidase-1